MAESLDGNGSAAPGSPGQSMADSGSVVTLGWQVEPREDVIHESFAKRMCEHMAQLKKEYGGPENYLRMRFQSRQDYTEWLQYLSHLIPPDAHSYTWSRNIAGHECDSQGKALLRGTIILTCPWAWGQ